MAKRGLRYQLEKCLAANCRWDRTILCLERSWKELNHFLERRDTNRNTKKKR